MKQRFIFLWIGIGLFILFAFLYLPGLSRLLELRSEEDRFGRELAEIDGKIKTLQEEKNLLQNDVAYLEKVIREELGLVKPGEIVYKLVPAKQAAPATKSSAKPKSSQAG